MSNNNNTVGEWDVLLGRGGRSNQHLGNRRFRALIAQASAEYLLATNKQKGLISRRIVQTIHQQGGRFLKQASSSSTSGSKQHEWIECADKVCILKASQRLRECLDVKHKTIRPSKFLCVYEDYTNPARCTVFPGTVVTAACNKQQQSSDTNQQTMITPDPTPVNSPNNAAAKRAIASVPALELSADDTNKSCCCSLGESAVIELCHHQEDAANDALQALQLLQVSMPLTTVIAADVLSKV
jgi:hypothetical protein